MFCENKSLCALQNVIANVSGIDLSTWATCCGTGCMCMHRYVTV